MRDCAICEIRMSSINEKELTQTNNTELLLKATYPYSGYSGRECCDVSAGVALELRVLLANVFKCDQVASRALLMSTRSQLSLAALTATSTPTNELEMRIHGPSGM